MSWIRTRKPRDFSARSDSSAERLASLDDLVYGASPMSATLLARVREALPEVRLSQGYGMTEASAVVTFLGPEDHVPSLPRRWEPRCHGSSGFPPARE